MVAEALGSLVSRTEAVLVRWAKRERWPAGGGAGVDEL